MASGKLHISSTDAYTGENILISNYHSKKEVIDVSKNQIHEGKSALRLDTIAAFVFGEYLKHFWIVVGQNPVKNIGSLVTARTARDAIFYTTKQMNLT